MSIKRHFVFLVFTRPDVVGVINFLSSVLSGRAERRAPHITIQGPFERRVSLDHIALIRKTLRNDTFFIGNVATLNTPSGAALVLRVTSDNLKKVWDKPDYPIDKFGFNPHITLYDGPDADRVARAAAFLARHRVEFVCDEFEVVQYVPKQLDLFPVDSVEVDEMAFTRMIGQGRIMSGFRAQFMAAVAGSEE